MVVVATTIAHAQPDAGAKFRGDYNFYGRSGGRSMSHARDYARGYRSYARQAPSVTPRIAREEAAGVGQNIDKAKQQFAEMRKATTDKETLAALDLIDRHLAEAARAHAEMHAMCQVDTVDAAGTMKCCDDIDAALGKAIAEHDKLMMRLSSSQPKK